MTETQDTVKETDNNTIEKRFEQEREIRAREKKLEDELNNYKTILDTVSKNGWDLNVLSKTPFQTQKVEHTEEEKRLYKLKEIEDRQKEVDKKYEALVYKSELEESKRFIEKNADLYELLNVYDGAEDVVKLMYHYKNNLKRELNLADASQMVEEYWTKTKEAEGEKIQKSAKLKKLLLKEDTKNEQDKKDSNKNSEETKKDSETSKKDSSTTDENKSTIADEVKKFRPSATVTKVSTKEYNRNESQKQKLSKTRVEVLADILKKYK